MALEHATVATEAFLRAMAREDRKRNPLGPPKVPQLESLAMTDRIMLINCIDQALGAASQYERAQAKTSTSQANAQAS